VLSALAVPSTYKEDNKMSYLRESVKKRVSLKGATVQRGLRPKSRVLVIVRSRYRATTSEDTAGWKTLSVIL
jgi:hypothetical protein